MQGSADERRCGVRSAAGGSWRGTVTSAETPAATQIARRPLGKQRYETCCMDGGIVFESDRGQPGTWWGAAMLRATWARLPGAAAPGRRLAPLRRRLAALVESSLDFPLRRPG